jgi:hypothetical protein
MPVDALAAKLQEKEQLVAVLTQRLEQAAEQLDRQRRNGGDKRRGGGGGAGIPPELLESQKQTLEEIGLAVERMEAAQAAETLGRIEAQVTEIRTLLLGDSPPVIGRGGASGGGPSLPAPREKEKASGDELTAESAWAALKARMLDADGKGEHRADPPRKSSQSEVRTENPAANPAAEKPVAPEPEPEPETPIDPPIAVNVETADREALAAAVVARDDYIGYLLRRLRIRESRSLKPVDWAAIEAPEELRERLEGLESRLQETLRRAEIESSLERARLGRAAAELEQRSARIEKELRRLGVDDDSRAAHDEEEAEKGPRWMRMLGLGKHDER